MAKNIKVSLQLASKALDMQQRLLHLVRRDTRFPIQAYQFLFEALDYATKLYGKDRARGKEKRHVTGQQLLEAIRQFALREFGYMALAVFEQWGIRRTEDFGAVVFTLVENGLLGKTKSDSRADFANGYDFHTAFDAEFAIDEEYDLEFDWLSMIDRFPQADG